MDLWALLPPWIGWVANALIWALFGWLTLGSIGSWFFFALAGMWCVLGAISFRRGGRDI